MPTTTRVTARFREHLEGLRRCVDRLPESALRESLDVRLALLAGDIGMGFPVTEEVEIEEPTSTPPRNKLLATLDLADDLEGLLDDTEPMLSAARDNRVSEVA